MMQKLNKMFRKYDFYIFNKRLMLIVFYVVNITNDTKRDIQMPRPGQTDGI